MLSQATQAYPNGYFYFEDKEGRYHCQKTLPLNHRSAVTRCNRIETLPLSAYLLRMQQGKSIYLDNPSLLGIHLEQVMPLARRQHYNGAPIALN